MTELNNKTKYEIINPSDCCYIYSDDELMASVSVGILSTWYGLADCNSGKTITHPFEVNEDWIKEHGIPDLNEYVKCNRNKMADILDSVDYKNERTSMNNIGKACHSIAKQLRELKE